MLPHNRLKDNPGPSNELNYSLSAKYRPQDFVDVQTRVEDNGDIPAKSTYRRKLEEKLDLKPFLKEMKKTLETPIKLSGSRRTNKLFSAKSVFKNEKERRKTKTSLYNTEHLDTRKRLREILMDDSDSDGDDGPVVTQLDVDIALKVHRMRRKIQKKYHKKMDNRKYMFYGAGLLSEYDPYPQHREVVKKIIKDSAGDLDLEKLGMETYWRTKLGIRTLKTVPIDGESIPGPSGTENVSNFDDLNNFDFPNDDEFGDSADDVDVEDDDEEEEEEDSLADVVDMVAKGALGGEIGSLSKRGRKKKVESVVKEKKRKRNRSNFPVSAPVGTYEDESDG